MSDPSSPPRFYLVTHPRTASNLLIRILSLDQQDKIRPLGLGAGYFFIKVMFYRWEKELASRPIDGWTDEEKSSMEKTYQESFDDFEQYLEDAKLHNKIAFVKEHGFFYMNPSVQWKHLFGESDDASDARWRVQVPSKYSENPTWSSLNNTVLPDEFLRTLKPIFLIRHPAMIFPSAIRAARDLENDLKGGQSNETKLMLNLGWTRALYEWYLEDTKKFAAQSGSSSKENLDASWPLVVDADDVIGSPAVVTRLCKLLGLDEAKMRFEWEPFTKEEEEKLLSSQRRMLSTLRTSTGIHKDKSAASIDIDAEAKKWRAEFGDEIGDMLEKCVREAMPHYEFMRARKLEA